jgi:hypothetical protein
VRAVRDPEAGAEELVRRARRAERARARRAAVCEVPARVCNVRREILSARLPRGRVERHELDGRAGDLRVADGWGWAVSTAIEGRRVQGLPWPTSAEMR